MKITVCITSYNQRHYLVDAIESVLAQTILPSQLVVVDDCSSDGSQDLIGDYAARFPRLICCLYHRQNEGVSQSRNDALKAATGDCLCMLDGDDRFLPSKLEKEARLLQENPDAQVAFSNYYKLDATGTRSGTQFNESELPDGNVFCQVFTRRLLGRGFYHRMLVRRDAWEKAGGYDPDLPRSNDYEMCIRLAKFTRAVYLDEPLSEYRVHNTGISGRSTGGDKFAAKEYIYRKNIYLLDDLDAEQREFIKRRCRKHMEKLAHRAAEEIARTIRPEERAREEVDNYITWASKRIRSFLCS